MSDVFTTESNPQVELVVNGSTKGTFTPTSNIGEFVKSKAMQYGIRTFSVYLDGRKLDTNEAGNSFPAGTTKLEIVTKDARG